MKIKNRLSIVIGVLLVISIIGNVFQGFSHLRSFRENYLSYEEFLVFFNYLEEGLGLEDYNPLDSNDLPQIVYIGEEASFGKRKYLTLDGEQSVQQTQKRIEYSKSDGSELVVIDMIYLDKPLYKDLLYWNDPLPNEDNKHVKDVVTDNLLSYKNTLIKLTVFSVSGNEESINNSLIHVTREVVDLISKLN